MSSRRLFVVPVLLGSLLAPWTPLHAASVGDPGRGASAYQSTCLACHGPGGEGVPNLGLPLKGSAFVAGKDDQQMLEFVKKGRMPGDPELKGVVPMPPKGGNAALTDEQILDIIAHIRLLK